MDPLEIAPFVSSGTGLLGGIINNIFATKNANKTNEQNLKIARETNQINKEIADQNFALQQDWNEYQKALQQQIFEREDTSYQRTAQDMLAAGLNPLSMQGTNGAGQVVSTSAPQNNFQAQQSAPMQQAALALDSASTIISGITSIFDQINSIKSGNLERDLLQTKIDEQKILNEKLDREHKHQVNIGEYDSDMLPERLMTHLLDWSKNGRFGQMFDFNLKDMINFFKEDEDTGSPLLNDIKSLLYSATNSAGSKLADTINNYQVDREKKHLTKSYNEIKSNEHVKSKRRRI